MFRQNLGKVKNSLFFFVALLLLAAPAVQAATYDLAADFSIASNPNGVWSYGYEPDGGGTFTPFLLTDTFSSSDAYGWHILANGYGGIPAVWKNTDASWNFPAGSVMLHPYQYSQAWSVARWTAPTAGTISISGMFGAGDTSGSMSYYIILNNNFITPLLSDWSDSSDKSFSFTNVSVSLGETLDFIVGPGAGGFLYGTTPLQATIESNPVPLPGAVWLLGSGLGFLAWRRRRLG